MPTRYSITLILLFMILALSRGFVLQQFGNALSLNAFHALADGGGGGGAGGGGGGGGGAGGGGGGGGGAGGGGGDGGGPTDVYGCTNPAAINYNPSATINDGSCTYPPAPVIGCMDPSATNYNPAATSQTGVTCTYTPVPTPTCILTTNPDTITVGGSSFLSWGFSSGVTSFSINNGIGVKTVPGFTAVSPVTTTTYAGSAAGPGGTAVCSATVAVTPAPVVGCMDPSATNYNPAATSQTGVTCTYPPAPAAPTCTLTANPASAPTGGTSTLSWTTTNATSASVSNGIGVIAPSVATGSGTLSVSPGRTYTLTAAGAGGTATCSATVAVTPPAVVIGCMDPSATNYNPAATSQTGVTCTYPPVPTPTCTLSASPASIQAGSSSALSWTTANATSFSINNGIGAVASAASGSHTVSPTATMTYTGTATGAGGTATCSVTVAITPTPPAVVYGCMDPAATNYNPAATSQTGITCTYPPAPAPTCTLTANPASIQAGSATALSWTTTNATSFAVDAGIGAVTPVASGSQSVSPGTTTTYTGTATGAGGTATCSATVTVTTTPPPPGAPTCTLSANPTSVTAGSFTSLSWTTTNGGTFSIDQNIGAVTPAVGGSINSHSINGVTTFTGTVISPTGQTVNCATTVTIAATGGGAGGPPPTYGGGSGGGALPPPTVTLAALPHVAAQRLAYLYLSQIPYTGLDLGPVGTTLYWLALIAWALALAYLVLFGAAPAANRSLRAFGKRVAESLNARELVPVPVVAREPHLIVASASAAPAPEAPRSYSSYDGFKSFARGGALSIDDIVKGLSRHHHATAKHSVEPVRENVEPIFENVEPVYEHVEAIPTGSDATPASTRGFIAALVEGDRAAVFAGLRQHVRGSGAPEKLITDIVCLLDDAYRARIDGTAADSDIARLTARLSTPVLEQLITALTTAIDSSYSVGVTGAKLALTRALSVLGA